jgi:DNA polymerase elongation subunit (family B)
MIYAFDIETIPNSSMVDKLPEPALKLGNVKDPAKIEEKKAEAKSKQVEKMALDPMFGRICSAVLTFEKDGELFSYPFAAGDNDEEEKLIITQIFTYFSDDARLVTWNGISFDLPYLFKRCTILSIPVNCKLSQWTKRHNNDRHMDLMQIWAGWSSQNYAKLDDVANVVLGEGKTDIDYKTFPELLKTEEGRARLIEYNTMDTVRTYQLYQRFTWGGMI